MTPIVIPREERCYCGRNDWQRYPGQACTLVCCARCGYTAAITPT